MNDGELRELAARIAAVDGGAAAEAQRALDGKTKPRGSPGRLEELGFIAGVAALAAVRVAPRAARYLIASHRSVEAGHRLVLQALGVKPLLDLELRLGEGTGAALAMPLVDAALAIAAEMATFAAAGVSGAVGRAR